MLKTQKIRKIDYTRYSGFRGENRATDLLKDLRPKKTEEFTEGFATKN